MLCLPLAPTIAKGYNLRKCEMFAAQSRMSCSIFFHIYIWTTNQTSLLRLFVDTQPRKKMIFRIVKKYQIAGWLKKNNQYLYKNSNGIFTVRIWLALICPAECFIYFPTLAILMFVCIYMYNIYLFRHSDMFTFPFFSGYESNQSQNWLGLYF